MLVLNNSNFPIIKKGVQRQKIFKFVLIFTVETFSIKNLMRINYNLHQK